MGSLEHMVKTPYILNTLAKLTTSVTYIENTISMLRAQIALPVSIVGYDGSSLVFKNGNGWVRDQNGLYHQLSCYVVDGQAQTSLGNTGYSYSTIP